ncbi:MAG: hypothetical protein ABIG92_00260 [Candidatus Omnitrophota bacterium]
MSCNKCKPIIFIFLIFVLVIGVFNKAGYSTAKKRDPFVPLAGYASDAYAVNDMKDIRLEGIVWEEGKSSIAIINGEMVKEGDQVGNFKLLRIEKNCIIFDNSGEEVKIDLRED